MMISAFTQALDMGGQSARLTARLGDICTHDRHGVSRLFGSVEADHGRCNNDAWGLKICGSVVDSIRHRDTADREGKGALGAVAGADTLATRCCPGLPTCFACVRISASAGVYPGVITRASQA